MNQKEYIFREATEEDIQQMKLIRDAVRENALGNGSIEIADYQKALFEDGKGWVALFGDQIVGFSCGRLKQRDVWALFIDKSHEGRGVGNQLMQLLEDWMFAKGIEEIELSTEPKTRAEILYRRRGWIEQPFMQGQDLVFRLTKPFD